MLLPANLSQRCSNERQQVPVNETPLIPYKRYRVRKRTVSSKSSVLSSHIRQEVNSLSTVYQWTELNVIIAANVVLFIYQISYF